MAKYRPYTAFCQYNYGVLQKFIVREVINKWKTSNSPLPPTSLYFSSTINKVRYKYLELIWYLKDTIKIPVFTWKRYLLDTKVGLKRYQYQFGLIVSLPPTCHGYHCSIPPFLILAWTLTHFFKGSVAINHVNFLVS